MGTITKRKWTYKGVEKTAYMFRYIDQTGQRTQETFAKWKEADAFRKKVENQIDAGTHVSRRDTCTVKDLGEMFLDECERRCALKDRMTVASLMNYRHFVRSRVIPQFGAGLITDLSSQMVQNWLDGLCKKHPRATVQTIFKALSVMLKFAVRKKLVGRNVIIEGGVRIPDMERAHVKIPSLADLQHVLKELDRRAFNERQHCLNMRRIVIGLGLFAGMRRGEIAGLQWENVDLDKGTLDVRHSLSFYDGLKSPKTWAGNRSLTIIPPVLLALRELHEERQRPKTGKVLLTQRGSPMTSGLIYKLWVTFAQRAGIADETGRPRWRFHDFRHAAASLLIAEGVTPLHIKTFMGHSSVTTTMNVYGHLFPDDTRVPKAIGAIAERLSGGARETHEGPKLLS